MSTSEVSATEQTPEGRSSLSISATSNDSRVHAMASSRSSSSRPQAQALVVPPRIQKELAMLARDPGPGISAWPATPDATHELLGQIVGPEDSPYRGGTYAVSITLPQRYPFEPPSVRFITPIYHPNIDSEGRICLDTLKMQPQGSWSPSININTLLLTIRLLMANPNANDGLVASITEQYRRNVEEFNRSAREHTLQHAMQPVAPQGQALETIVCSKDASPQKSKIDELPGTKRRPVCGSDGESSDTSSTSYASSSLEESNTDGSDDESDDSRPNRTGAVIPGSTKRPKLK